MQVAREALREKREKRSELNDYRTKILKENSYEELKKKNKKLKNQINELNDYIEFLKKLLSRYDDLLDGFFEEKGEGCDKIIYDLFKCYVEPENNCSEKLIDMCIDITDVSEEAYKIIKNYIPVLPTLDYLKEIKKKKLPDFSKDLLDIEKIPEMIVNFKKENSITGEMKLYCCLAVDALYFRPDIKVGPNGVNGFLKNIEVDKKQLTSFENNIEYFISFVRDHWSEIIKAGFVYQINPFFFPIKPIVIHIIPTSHGKANNQIIEKLYTIKNILHNYRIEIMSFSFDGDNAFGPMNQNFYETFINRMIKKNSIPIGRALSIRISPDPLHITKRFRYRFLSNDIHMGFTIESPKLDIQKVQRVLKNVPPIVFLDLPITKMHDQLAIILFSLRNFISLFENKMYYEAAYWFPISIFITAMHYKNVGYQNRIFFFQVAIWFLTYYKKYLDEYKLTHLENDNLLRERKYKNEKDVLPYSTSLLIEFTNCLYSKITLSKKYENIDLDRDSTGPLEHTFGRSRLKCNNIHTIEKFIKAIGEINDQSLKKITNDIEKVKGRSLNFGVIIEDKNKDNIYFTSTPQQIANEFLCLINIIPENPLEKNDYDNLFSFVEYLKDFVEEKSSRPFTINNITLQTQQTKTITQRMTFTISNEKIEFIEFLKTKIPGIKIDKKILLEFYQNMIDYVPLFPCIEEKRPSKKIIIDHLNENFYAFNEKYISLIEKFK